MTASKLTELMSLLPVPAHPIDVDESFMPKNEEALGTRFPRDFVEYSTVYGSGEVRATPWMWEIWSACRPSYPGIMKLFFEIWSEVRDAAEMHDVPIGLFPEPGGLLPFGISPSGNWFAWKTIGAPDEWKVWYLANYAPDGYQITDLPFVEMLLRLLRGELDLGFDILWKVDQISFTPRAYYP